MSEANQKELPSTISRELAVRLKGLPAKQTVRAMVMLRTDENGMMSPSRPSRQGRETTIQRVREVSRSALPYIDMILSRHQGKRLSEDVDALGSITVETTAAGIRDLSASEYVKAILEDQPIFQLPSKRT
jgi:hypothetical protein